MSSEPDAPTEAAADTPETVRPKGAPEFDERPFLDASADAKSRYGRFNLAIIGDTGVGKSSLVNAVFGRDWAKVGKGLPVTRGVRYYSDDTLGIWDVEGFEIGTDETPAEMLRRHRRAISERPANEQISVVWYCIESHSHRITQPAIDMMRSLEADDIPVILVMTKVDWSAKNPINGKRTVPAATEDFRRVLHEMVDANQLPVQRIILTSTQGKGAGRSLGELVTATLALSPDDEKDAFRIAQRLNLPWKRELARPVIVGASSAAAAAAAVPVPVADSAILAPIQLGMMGRIATIYDLEIKTMLSAGALAQLGVQLAGKALASSAIKVIPGVGSVVNAGVAAALTAATGEGWMRLCEQVHTGKLDLAKVNDSLGDYVPGFLDIFRKMAEQKIAKS